MKIGFTLDTLLSLSGKERVVYELAKRFTKKHEITIITFKNKASEEIVRNFEKEGINFAFFNYQNEIKGRINYLTNYKKQLSSLNLDVINTHGLILANAAALSIIPTVKTYHAHVTVWNEFLFNPIRWIDYYLEESISICFAKKVITISNYAKSQLKKLYFKDPIVIPNGVDVSNFKPNKKLGYFFREKFGLSSNELIIGYIGRFVKAKNQQLLLKLSKKIKGKIILVGSGPLENFYKKNANKRKILFLKNLTEKELVGFYNAIDIYVHPSLWESFGLPLLEAQACEKPVIAFNRTAVKEAVIHEKTGFLANNEEEFKKYLETLTKDEDLRKKLGKKGKFFARKFDWKKIFKKYENILVNFKNV